MRALIDPRQNRVCQVQQDEFAVAEPFFWVDCDEAVTPETHDYVDGDFVEKRLNPRALIDARHDQYPSAALTSVNSIMQTGYTGVDLAVVKRTSDGAVIGVEATRAYTVSGAPVGATMLALKAWMDDGKRLGVPLFAFLRAESNITQSELTGFFKAQGFIKVDELDEGEYVALPWTADLARARKHRDIDAARDRAINAGFEWDGNEWDADPVSRGNLTGVAAAVNAGLSLPDGFAWRTKDNQNVPLDSDGVMALAGAMLAHVNQCYVNAWSAKAAVSGMSDPAAIMSAEE